MTLTRHKLAEVLDSVADYIEGVEAVKVAEERSAKRAHIDKLAESYELATGQTLPDAAREKLAGSLDHELLEQLTKAAKHSGESPESLGSPSTYGQTPVPTTVKEAAAHAEDQFINWIIS